MEGLAPRRQDPWMIAGLKQMMRKERYSEWYWVGVLRFQAGAVLHQRGLKLQWKGHSQWEDLHRFQRGTAGSMRQQWNRALKNRRRRGEWGWRWRSWKHVRGFFDSHSSLHSSLLRHHTFLIYHHLSYCKTRLWIVISNFHKINQLFLLPSFLSFNCQLFYFISNNWVTVIMWNININ